MGLLNIVYSLFCLVLMVLGLYKLYPVLRKKPLGEYLPISISFKLFYTLLLLCVYKFYYGAGDIIAYSREFEYFTQILFDNPLRYFGILSGGDVSGDNHFLYSNDIRSWFFIRTFHFVYLLGGNNYYTSGILFSLLFFLSAFQFANTIVIRFSVKPFIVVVAFFLLPSFGFWCSAFLKETVTIAMLFLVLGWIMTDPAKRNWYLLPFIVCFLYVCTIIKFYFVGPVLAFTASYVIADWITRKRSLSVFTSVAIFLVVLCVMGVLSSQLHYSMWPEYFARSIWVNYFVSVLNAKPGTYFILESIGPDISDILKSLPEALFQGLLAPLPGLIRSPLTLMAAMENYALFILLLFSVPELRKLNRHNLLIVVCLLLFIATTASLLAMTSPNPGNLVRYKVIFTPFLCMLALHGFPARFLVSRD